METAKPAEIFDISALDSVDVAEMVVTANGVPTTWVWQWAGPAHEKTIAQSDRLLRERLATERLQEQARVNGKKWKADVESVEAVRARNVNFLLERLLGWNTVKLGGEMFPYSQENARRVLSDPRKPSLYNQAWEFLGGEEAFTKRSATNSAPSPSERSTSTLSKTVEPGETA